MTEKDLYEIIIPVIENLFRVPTKDDEKRNGEVKHAFMKFVESGWIPPYSLELAIHDIVRLSENDPKYIDDYIYSKFIEKNFQKCKLLIKRLKQYRFDNPQYFTCAMILYRKGEHMGCCVMILSLIEQTIIHIAGTKGSVSDRSKEVIKTAFSNISGSLGGYYEHPIKYLMIEPLGKLLLQYFKSVHNFDPEPPIINRNFLVHGMAKREYTHRDCIKLFVILEFLGKYTW